MGPSVRSGVRRSRPRLPPHRRGSLARRRDVPEGRRDLALPVPGIDQFGQVIDVFLSPLRDALAARRFFAQALGSTRVSPTEVTTDRYRVYPRLVDEMFPAASHRTKAHANNLLKTDHGRLKARLRPMRGLKRDRTARVIVAGHAFIQNLRRGFYDLGTDVPYGARLADAFGELAQVI